MAILVRRTGPFPPESLYPQPFNWVFGCLSAKMASSRESGNIQDVCEVSQRFVHTLV